MRSSGVILDSVSRTEAYTVKIQNRSEATVRQRLRKNPTGIVLQLNEEDLLMRAARMYGYNQPLVLEEVGTPEIAANEVLVKVEAAGMCRTDVQLIDGYFKD